MKKLVISALLVVVTVGLFSSCTSVPQDRSSNVQQTSSTSTSYSK